ncbi:ribosome modulation factor [Methylobacterium sp. J-068]|uniref:ribosome modulation factor n=1 Tax=Methylobacterium sp. J-068 TaxID=2836649 RepID=UPI003919E257
MFHSGAVKSASERGVTVMAQTRHSHTDPIEEGAQARIHGRPKDACPYPRDSEKRAAWMEGYDGTPREHGPDLPLTAS